MLACIVALWLEKQGDFDPCLEGYHKELLEDAQLSKHRGACLLERRAKDVPVSVSVSGLLINIPDED